MSRQSALQSTQQTPGPLGPHRVSGSPLCALSGLVSVKGLMHSQCGVVGGSVVVGSVDGWSVIVGSVVLP